MGKEHKRAVILFLVMIFLLFGYLYLINIVETKKIYPQEKEWFTFSMLDYTDNSNCTEFYKARLTYCNDASQCEYRFTHGRYGNLMYAYIPIRKICDFNELSVTIIATNISFSPAVIDDENLNLTIVKYLGNDSYKVIIKNGSWDLYELKILIPIKENFFNYYRIIDGNRLGFETVSFSYKNSIFNGYLADESSFNVIEGNVVEERPIFSNTYKWFKFDSESTLIRFNPKSKPWFLFQKILDTLLLGIIAVMIYEIDWLKLLQFLKKVYKSTLQELSMKHIVKIEKEITHITIKDFLKDNSPNLVALSVFLLVAITLSSHGGGVKSLFRCSFCRSFLFLVDRPNKDG